MRTFNAITVGVLGAAAVAAASDVHDLKKDTFAPFIKEHDLVLAESLAPEYEEAATELKKKDIPLVKVDCTEEAELCQTYGVEGYPTVKVFRGPDNVSPYSGPRKAPAIISYMTKQSLPAVSTISSDSLEEFKKADKVVLVAFFDASDKTANTTFTAVADSLRDSYLFGATNDVALAKAEGVSQPAIVLYKDFDEGKNTFTEKFDKETIEKFAKTAAVPLVGEVGPETYADYMAAGVPLAYIFAETPEERAELAKTLKPVAQKHKGKISVATIDAKAFGAHAGNLNLDPEKFPAFAIQETVKNQKFPYDQSKKLTEKDIGKFVQDFLDGKIQPSVKSEPVPESQDGPVHVIVAHNYEDIVMDNDKDVLVEFYAPWCGHCKALAPKYEELGNLYFSNPEFAKKVTVAKVDATANDVPDEIQGFPTIKLFPAGGKDAPVDYSGERTVEGLANFIKEKGKYKVDAYTSEDDDSFMPDAEDMGKQAPAASKVAENVKDKVKSKVSEAADTVKTVIADSDADGAEHDEL
ncbi:MAG: protein disulfide-isomerase precursor [Caeruleum heppii]|nr:MAG: protein disulfide-isomerase precursor [Caeruleum heppii]